MVELSSTIEKAIEKKYEYGFVTDIDMETFPPGLDEDVVAAISKKKNEPEFLLNWRLKAYRHWCALKEPHWAHLQYTPIDYQKISYYAAPKSKKDGPKSLDEVDPKLIETYNKLGIPLYEQQRLQGIAVDAVFDSVSVATTFKEKLSALHTSLLMLFSLIYAESAAASVANALIYHTPTAADMCYLMLNNLPMPNHHQWL